MLSVFGNVKLRCLQRHPGGNKASGSYLMQTDEKIISSKVANPRLENGGGEGAPFGAHAEPRQSLCAFACLALRSCPPSSLASSSSPGSWSRRRGMWERRDSQCLLVMRQLSELLRSWGSGSSKLKLKLVLPFLL